MHRGCFVSTPTPHLAGLRMPRPAPVRVCECSSVLAGSGGRASGACFWHHVRVLVRLTLSCGRFVLLLCSAPSGLGLPLSWSFFFVSFVVSARPLCLLLSLVSGPGCLGPRCLVFRSSQPPRPVFFFFFSFPPSFCAPVVSGFLWLPAPGALGLGAVCCLFCWLPASRLSVGSRLVCVSRPAVGCFLVVAASPSPSPFVCRGFRRHRSVPFFFLFFSFPSLSAPLLSPAFSGFRPRVPRALALCVLCFVGLPLLGSLCPPCGPPTPFCQLRRPALGEERSTPCKQEHPL